ncbi:MAG: LytTR family transcriptional regulator [Sphingomonadales bacterium]|nr:MAG: LytTR family transcriptional regulator [Sphingomonadales bacterium]
MDFLTKPVLMSRLEKAMARIEAAIADRSAHARLKDLSWQLDGLRSTGTRLGDDPHIWIQGRGESFRLSLDRIEMVRAEAEYVRLVIGEVSYLYREPLGDFLKRLDPDKFVRVHRSLILNRRMIAAVRRRATGSYRVMTVDGEDLAVGKSFRQAVRAVVGS